MKKRILTGILFLLIVVAMFCFPIIERIERPCFSNIPLTEVNIEGLGIFHEVERFGTVFAFTDGRRSNIVSLYNLELIGNPINLGEYLLSEEDGMYISMQRQGSVAYFLHESGFLEIVDFSDPPNPTLDHVIDFQEFGTMESFIINDNIIYLLASVYRYDRIPVSTLYSIDISNGPNFHVISSHNEFLEPIAIIGDYLIANAVDHNYSLHKRRNNVFDRFVDTDIQYRIYQIEEGTLINELFREDIEFSITDAVFNGETFFFLSRWHHIYFINIGENNMFYEPNWIYSFGAEDLFLFDNLLFVTGQETRLYDTEEIFWHRRHLEARCLSGRAIMEFNDYVIIFDSPNRYHLFISNN